MKALLRIEDRMQRVGVDGAVDAADEGCEVGRRVDLGEQRLLRVTIEMHLIEKLHQVRCKLIRNKKKE